MMKKSGELASTDDKTKRKRAAKIYIAANAPTGPKIKVKEQTDLYDIILSHLLDEGYADTQEQAEVIMVNMSEEWRESICEEYKKLPVGKMMWKAVNRTEREADTRADRESEEGTYYYYSNNKQRQEHERAQRDKEKNNKMIRVADTHSKKEAKAKSKFKK
jgi:hypothetical protein